MASIIFNDWIGTVSEPMRIAEADEEELPFAVVVVLRFPDPAMAREFIKEFKVE